jgi:hypothetical protein
MSQTTGTWNGWWTFTLIAAALTIMVGLLEVFGVVHDVGIGLGIIGLVATIVGSAQAATRGAVETMDRRLNQMHDTLLHIGRLIERLPERLAERLKGE